MAYARSVVQSTAAPVLPDPADRDAALSLVSDALLAALASDLIDDDTAHTLRRGLRYWSAP